MPLTAGGMRATALVMLVASGTLLVGLLILIGGPVRFSGPSFATARQLAPWWAWGGVMASFGLVALYGARWHVMWASWVGHSGAGLVYVFWVVALAYSTISNPAAALTGLGIYSAFGVMHAFAATSSDLERRAWNELHKPPAL